LRFFLKWWYKKPIYFKRGAIFVIEEILDKKDEKEAARALSKLGFSDGKRALKNFELIKRSPLGGDPDTLCKAVLASPSPDQALTNLERITESLPRPTLTRFLEDGENLGRLVTVCGSSPYLSTVMARNVEFFEELFLGGVLNERKTQHDFQKEIIEWTEGAGDFNSMGRALRRYKNREYLRIGSRDLLGMAPLEEVTGELSDLASASVDAAHGFCMEELKASYGRPVYIDKAGNEQEAELSVIGLGKLGGRELNFSSDIDIIYVYTTEKGTTTGPEGAKGAEGAEGAAEKPETRLPLHQFFVKLSERITRLISRVIDEGFVFRVDLDLRPEGRSGELANSLRSMEIYYESWGQSWERGAMIKARCVAGGRELGRRFMEMIRPFVYRKHLDIWTLPP
jgi:glutamate-ammonia-ligase adenylyltransferase